MDRKDFIKQSAIISGGMVFPRQNNIQHSTLDETPFTPKQLSGISATDLQKKLKAICGLSNVGCAVNSDWLIRQTKTDINSSAGAISKTSEPTSIPKIRAGIDFKPGSISLQTVNSKIILSGFSPIILLVEDSPNRRVYNKLQVAFTPTELKLDIDYATNKLGFFLSNNLPSFSIPELSTNPHLDPTVVTQNGMSVDEFLQNQKLILFSQTNLIELLEGFVLSISFPKLMEAMGTFHISPPYKYTFQDGYIFIAGTLGITDQSCPCAGADGFRVNKDLKQTTNPTQSSPAVQNGFNFQYSQKLTPTTVDADRIRLTTDIDTPHFAYYYPKEITFTPFIKNKITPAISFGDDGSFLLFKWFYRVSVNIRSNFPVITIDTSKKNLVIDTPFDIIGGAGFSIKIGCVYIPLAHSTVQGGINPSKVTITPTLTIDNDGLSLYAKPDYEAAVDVHFFDPPLVDVLLNIVMGSFGNNLINKEIRKRINSLNIKIVDFSILGIDSKFGWLYGNIADADSLLVAFKRDEG